jgi:hypothetical protein
MNLASERPETLTISPLARARECEVVLRARDVGGALRLCERPEATGSGEPSAVLVAAFVTCCNV